MLESQIPPLFLACWAAGRVSTIGARHISIEVLVIAFRLFFSQVFQLNLSQCRAFIFDLDGTLTLAVHDFEAIRRSLGIPAGVPILEYH